MNVFDLRERVVGEYAEYFRSLVEIRDPRIRRKVDAALDEGLLWPEPYIGLSPAFEPGSWIDDLVEEGLLHPECWRVFRRREHPDDVAAPLGLHRPPEDAIRRAHSDRSYVLTTGTWFWQGRPGCAAIAVTHSAEVEIEGVEDTIEDPDRGSHEDFRDLILAAAVEVRRFSSSPSETRELVAFLSEHSG